jgi:HSP20 family protein
LSTCCIAISTAWCNIATCLGAMAARSLTGYQPFIDVSMDNGVLSVSGERLAIAPDNDTGVQRIERASGRFLRRFTLPETADAEAIAAKCSNGILEVTIPKAPEIQARRITVEAA